MNGGEGSQRPAPLYFLIVIEIYNIWCTLGKPLGFTFIICQKNPNLKISNMYCNFKLLSKKGVKTRSVQYMINYTFLKNLYSFVKILY